MLCGMQEETLFLRPSLFLRSSEAMEWFGTLTEIYIYVYTHTYTYIWICLDPQNRPSFPRALAPLTRPTLFALALFF